MISWSLYIETWANDIPEIRFPRRPNAGNVVSENPVWRTCVRSPGPLRLGLPLWDRGSYGVSEYPLSRQFVNRGSLPLIDVICRVAKNLRFWDTLVSEMMPVINSAL